MLNLRHLKAAGYLVLVASLGMSVALAKPESAPRAERAQIDSLRESFNRAYAAGDAAGLAELLTDDAVWMPPGEPVLRGRRAVAERYARQFATARSEFQLERGEMGVGSETGWLRGSYRRVDAPSAGGPSTTTVGKYLMLFERQRGTWRIAADIWNTDAMPVQLDATVVLAALRGLAEERLQAVSRTLQALVSVPEVQSGDWSAMAEILRAFAGTGIQANAVWYVNPDGSYFTVEKGATGLSLSDRPYFPSLMAGKRVLGTLVISRSTGRRSVIVAEPVKRDGRVVGGVGVSYDVEVLSREVARQLRLPAGTVFYALNPEGQTALHLDPARMFEYPSDMGDASLADAVAKMRSRERGTVRYVFQGQPKVVFFERSPLLGWVFAVGAATSPASP